MVKVFCEKGCDLRQAVDETGGRRSLDFLRVLRLVWLSLLFFRRFL